MIEIICDGKNDTDKTQCTTKKELPRNIRQIGDVAVGKRIYIEDYAFTYINSVAYQSHDAETAGVLLGEVANTDGQTCIFIKGVIKAKNPDDEAGNIVFNEAVWSMVYREIEEYFPELAIVGWFAALPRITPEAVCRMKKLHYDNFAGKDKTMYLIDIEEKDENFYLYENGDITKQRGYVCFYERNQKMQEYMLVKNENKSVDKPETERVVSSVRALMREKEEERRRARSSLVSYAACAFMTAVVALTGINLIKSYEKMKRIDSSISDIVMEVANLNVKETQEESEDVVPVNVVYETKATETATGDASSAVNGTTSGTSAGSAGTSGGSTSSSAGNTGTSGDGTSSSAGSAGLSGEGTSSSAGNAGTSGESAGTSGSSGSSGEGTGTSSGNAGTSGEGTGTSSGSTGVSTGSAYTKYTVQQGDTILGISKRYYGTTQKAALIIEINNLTDADKLYVGQEIKLP